MIDLERIRKKFKERLNYGGLPVIRKKEGKHYVLGDIHGCIEPYNTALRIIKPEDSLVILGDVIDRGKNGIDILQDLIKRKANRPDSNITFILGNHEKMMMDTIELFLEYSIYDETMYDIYQYYEYQKRINRIKENIIKEENSTVKENISEDGRLNIEKYTNECEGLKEKIKQNISADVNLEEMLKRVIEKMELWCHESNGGADTLISLSYLTLEQQRHIYNFLKSAYVIKQQNIQGKNILFVHATPPEDIDLVKGLNQSSNGGLKVFELAEKDINFMVWNREVDTYSQCKKLGIQTICGHTYERNTTIVDNKRGYICIDEGCGHSNFSSVGFYCIEDRRIIHIGQDGNITEANEIGKIKIIGENGKETTIEGNIIPTYSGR